MVRLGALTTALALLFGGGAAAGPGVYASVEQLGDASWIVGGGSHPDFYFALGLRMVGEEGPLTVGAVGRGRCDVQKGKNFTMISCMGRGRGKEIPMEDFRMDPLLESGSLRVRLSGYRHTVSWTGSRPGPHGHRRGPDLRQLRDGDGRFLPHGAGRGAALRKEDVLRGP